MIRTRLNAEHRSWALQLRFLVSLLALALLLVACGGSEGGSAAGTGDGAATGGGEEAPAQEAGGPYDSGTTVTIVAGAAPGSGFDVTARAIQQALQEEELVEFPLVVRNQDGASGAVALADLVTAHEGESDIMDVASLVTISNELRGDSEYGWQDTTPVARLITEYYVVAVPADSEYQTLDDLIQAVIEDPQGTPIGAGGDDRLPFALMVSEAGGDPQSINFISYSGGGELVAALLGGEVDAALSGVSEFRGQLESGDLRGLAVTSEERLGGVVADVPTATELGIDVTLGNWRGLFGPPGMPEEAVTYWEDTLAQMIETPTWQEIAQNNQWDTTFMTGEEFREYLAETTDTIRRGLQETGVIQ